MLTRITRWGLLTALVALVLVGSAHAQNVPVALGSDYFETVPGNCVDNNCTGTWFNFMGTDIALMGVPLGGPDGTTDTIVQRQGYAEINGPAVPIQITALSLESEAPVDYNGAAYNVFITLDPAHLMNDIGMIQIMGNNSGGTFNSNLNVYFEAEFTPVGGGTGFNYFGNIDLTSTNSPWSSTPQSNYILLHGPLGDQNANCHNGTGPYGCLNPNGSDGYVDFFGMSDECGGSNGCHEVNPATSPEPSTLFLLGPVGIGLFWKLRARRSTRA